MLYQRGDAGSELSQTSKHKNFYHIVQRLPNVFDVGSILYKCYTNTLSLLGTRRLKPPC